MTAISRWKILLVEDSEDDTINTQSLLTEAAQREGQFELRWAASYEAALLALDDFSPDVALVDYKLGGHTGLDFVRALRERGARIPALLLTDHSAYDVDVEAMQAGVADTIEKDQLSAHRLERAIRCAIERQQSQARLESLNEDLEARVRETNQLFDRVFSTIYLAVAYMDCSFNFIRVNRAYALSYNRTEAFFPGKNHFELYPNPENETIFRRVVQTGAPYFAFARPFEYAGHPELGVTYWDWSLQPVKEADGTVQGLILSLLDVTEQHNNRQALQYQGSLLDNVNDAIVATDVEFRYTGWNRAAEQIYGWKRAEMLGKNALELPDSDLVDVSPEEMRRQLQETGFFQGEAMQTCRNGKRILVELKITVLRDEQGQVSGYASIHSDITARRAAEAQAREARARTEAQADLSRELAAANFNIQKIFDTLAARVAETIGDACVVTCLDKPRKELLAVAHYHPDPAANALLGQVLANRSRQPGEGFEGLVIQTGKPLLIQVVPQDQVRARMTPEYWPYLDAFGVHSALVVPLEGQGGLIGTLSITRDQPGRPYSEEDQLFLEALAGRAALWVSNAALFESAQKELAERRRVETELHEIKSRLIDAAEAERLQLARELHDGPIQELYGLSLQLRLVDEALRGSAEAEITGLQASVQRIIDSLRATSVELRPPVLTRFGILPAIRAHAEQASKAQPDLLVRLDLFSDNPQENTVVISERVKTALYRIYQMALTNVMRHAQAQHVDVRLCMAEENVVMEITDDGVGFQVPERWVELARQGHLGLVGALERAEALGGRLEVVSQPGQGTTLRVTLPRV